MRSPTHLKDRSRLFAGSRILIAGGNGFLGRALTDYLQTRGGKISWLTRRKVRPPAGVDAFVWSYSRNAAWRNKSFTDLIIATGAHSLPVSQQDTQTLFDVSVHVPFHLAMWAAGASVRHVVYFSSGSVLTARVPVEAGTFNIPRPLVADTDFYSCTKLAAECLLRTFQRDYPLHVIRLFRPYGPGANHGLINRILKQAVERQHIRLTAPDGPLIQPVFSTDVCAVTGALLRIEASVFIDLAGKERVSLGGLLRRWRHLTGLPIQYEIVPEHARNDPDIPTTGLTKLDALITTSLDQGLQTMLASGNQNN